MTTAVRNEDKSKPTKILVPANDACQDSKISLKEAMIVDGKGSFWNAISEFSGIYLQPR